MTCSSRHLISNGRSSGTNLACPRYDRNRVGMNSDCPVIEGAQEQVATGILILTGTRCGIPCEIPCARAVTRKYEIHKLAITDIGGGEAEP